MKRDGRSLDHKSLETLRLMAMERLAEGERASAVMASFGFCRTTIYKWQGKLRSGEGLEALRSRTGSGRPPKLTPAQERKVLVWVNGKDPRQHGFDFGLWTRAMVARLIEEKFAVGLSLASVGALLARLGLTPQKPLQRAYQRDPEAIAAWKSETFPKLAARARRSGADIWFWDEAGFRADSVHGRTWAKKGQTPVVAVPGQRQTVSAASAVNARGAFWCMTYKGGLDADLFVTMLKLLMRRRRNPLYLVLDNLPTHKAKVVRDYVETTKGKLELHFLPGYAPELNPDELVWNHMKRTGVARRPLRAGEVLQDAIDAQMKAIGENPALVRAFFRAKSVAYITD